MDYGFPGNVRELRNIVIRLTTKYAGREVNLDHGNLTRAAKLLSLHRATLYSRMQSYRTTAELDK